MKTNTLTHSEHNAEWRYIIDERRGMIAGASPLTPEQEALAQREAREHMDAIEAQSMLPDHFSQQAPRSSPLTP